MTETTQHDSLLSFTSKISISEYRKLEKAGDKKKIVAFIRERFTERYITPLRGDSNCKNGFCTMAICCLMIEALESFWRGWKDSNSKSETAFFSFFDRNPLLYAFHGHVEDFYKSIRCGILHQAETANGWLISRKKDAEIFNPKTQPKTINATKFHIAMEKCLKDYCDVLEKSDWNSDVWLKFRRKMQAIIANCKAKQ